MASELDLLLYKVHMNVGSDSHWDSESGKPSVDNLLSKTSYSKQFVNCERFEGKFGTECNRYDEVCGLELNVPKWQVIPCSSEGDSTILSDLQLAAMCVSVRSDLQIICDQFSGIGSSVEDSIPVQDPHTRGLVRFNLATDLTGALLSEDEDILDMGEEDIHTLSTSGSEVDYAVVESSSNPLAVIEEEAAEATDEDQDMIPIDDIPVKMGNLDPGEINRHCPITSESNCMSEQPPVFLSYINSMAFNCDGVPFFAVTPDDGSNSDVLVTRPYDNAPRVSVDDGCVDLEWSEMCDSDDEDEKISSCPEISTPFGDVLDFPDTTASHAEFKESHKSSVMLCKGFSDPGTRFLSGCKTETWSPADVEESVTPTDKGIHFSESYELKTIKSLDNFVCDREITEVKDRLSSGKSFDVDYVGKKGCLLSHIPSAHKMGRKHSLLLSPSYSSPSNRPNVVYLSDSEEEELSKQRCHCIMSSGCRHSRVSAITAVEGHQLLGNEGIIYNFSTGQQLPYFVDYDSFASLVSLESHEEQGVFHSELAHIFSADGGKSSHPPPINRPQNKFIVGLGVREPCVNSQSDNEDVEVTEEIRNSREKNIDGAKSLLISPLEEVQYFCGTAAMVHESKPKGVNSEPCYVARKTYSGMVDLESGGTHEAVNMRVKDLQLQKKSIFEDNVAEDSVGDSDMVLKCYKNSSKWKKGTSEIKFMDVDGEAYLVVVPSGKILSMNTAHIRDENFDTCARDMQVLSRSQVHDAKPSLFTPVRDGRTVAGCESFKIKANEKTLKFHHDIPTVRDNFHKSLLHISLLESDVGSHALPFEDGSGLCTTDIDDLSTRSGVQRESDIKQTSPEFSVFDGSIIDTSEIRRVLRQYKYDLDVHNSQEPNTVTEGLYFHGFLSGRHGTCKEELRLILLEGDKGLITDVRNLEVSETQYSTQHTPAPIFSSRKHDDSDRDIEYMGMSEEDTSITRCFVTHMDYSAVASLKETDNGPFPTDMLQVLPRTSVAASVIKGTSSGPDMYSDIATEVVDLKSTDGGDLLMSSHRETSAPVEMDLGIENHIMSTICMKSTHDSDTGASGKVDHLQGCDNIWEVDTDVEEFGLTEEELPQDQPDDNIHVIDVEGQVCVCVASEKETQNTVCVCVGKCHGQLSMEWRSSSGLSASETSSGNSTQGHEGMISILDLSFAAASLPSSCIRADLPSMQVAVPHYNLEPVGSNPLACSCEFSWN
jgi:hypothetical protein